MSNAPEIVLIYCMSAFDINTGMVTKMFAKKIT